MKHKTLLRLLVKLLGLYMLAVSMGPLFATMIALVRSAVVTSQPWWQVAERSLYVLPQVVIGLYLFLGGEWVVNRLIPSNRPYCPQCAYDLTGNVSGVCPECGSKIEKPEPNP